jgi:hypothetical protein
VGRGQDDKEAQATAGNDETQRLTRELSAKKTAHQALLAEGEELGQSLHAWASAPGHVLP